MRYRWMSLLLSLLMVAIGGIPAQAEGHGEKSHVLDTSEENMKRIAKSLGVECTHCHIAKNPDGEIDHEAPSPLKETAIHMKVHFVDSLKTADGKALTCVSCHNGAAHFLPRDMKDAKPSNLAEHMDRREIIRIMRSQAKQLGVKCDFCHLRSEDGRLTPEQPTKHKLMAKYMMDNFAGKLVTLDGEPATCQTCHHGQAEFLPRSEQGEE